MPVCSSKLVSVSSDLNAAWLRRFCEVLTFLQAAQACKQALFVRNRACLIGRLGIVALPLL